MKKIKLFDKENPKKEIGVFDTIPQAQEYLFTILKKGKSIFDFSIQEFEVDNVLLIDSYETAMGLFKHAEVDIKVSENNIRQISAFNKLLIIADAWNKSDNFFPDWNNINEYKYYPYFKMDSSLFAFSSSDASPSMTDVYIGSRLCFKTEKRARQFGTQFKNLWCEFLLGNHSDSLKKIK